VAFTYYFYDGVTTAIHIRKRNQSTYRYMNYNRYCWK